MTEEWRKVGGSDKYEVSNLGHVRRKVSYNRYRKHKPYRNKRGYYICHIVQNGRRKTLSLANLVATMFVNNECNGWVVRHKNGDVSDNKSDNLYWVNPKRRIGWE